MSLVIRVAARCFRFASEIAAEQRAPGLDDAWSDLVDEVPELDEAPLHYRRHVRIQLALAHAGSADEHALTSAIDALTTLAAHRSGAARAALATLLVARFHQEDRDDDLNRAVDHLEHAVDDPGASPHDRANRQVLLGEALLSRFRLTGARADLDRALFLFGRALKAAAPRTREHVHRTDRLGVGNLIAYSAGGPVTRLDRAITLIRQAHAARTDADPDRPASARRLAAAVTQRLGLATDDERRNTLPMLDEVIALWSEATTTHDPLERERSQLELADLLRIRFTISERPTDLERAVGVLTIAADECDGDSPRWSDLVSRVGEAHLFRYQVLGDADDLVEALEAVTAAGRAEEHHDPVTVLNRHAAVSYAWFSYAADPDALEQGIRLSEDAGAYGGGSDRRAESQSLLAQGLLLRYDRAGAHGDLTGGIAFAEAATREADNGTVRAGARYWLAYGLLTLFEFRGEVAHLDRALAECQAATAEGPSMVVRLLLAGLLGRIRHTRYRRLGDPQDLNGAIASFDAAIQRYGAGVGMNPVAHAVLDRYRLTGDLRDLRTAVQAFDLAFRSAPRDSVPARYLADSAGAWLYMYGRTGDPVHLTYACDRAEDAADRVHPTAPDRPRVIAQLASTLLVRHTRTGQVEELARAVAGFENAVHACPSTSPDRPAFLVSLADALVRRYQLQPSTDPHPNLTAAIHNYELAAGACPADSPDRSRALASLGDALLLRHRATPDETSGGYLMSAIEKYEAALAGGHRIGGARWPALLGLGASLLERYRSARNANDLAWAGELLAEAVDGLPDGAPAHTSALAVQASVLRRRYDVQHDPANEAAAIAAFERACDRAGEHRVLLAAAQEWSTWAIGRRSWSEADRALTAALRTVTDMFRVQLVRRHKETSLLELRGLPARAAFVKIQLNDLPAAVAVLEQWRAVLLSESLGLDETELERLADGQPDLHGRYTAAAERLAELQLIDLGRRATALVPARDADVIAAARDELAYAVDAIRGVPGCDGFQRPPTFVDIAALGLELPLVYLLSTGTGGAALVLRPGAAPEVTHVDLPELADRAVAGRLHRYLDAYKRRHTDDHHWRRVLNEVTGWLWDAAMGPVTEALSGERQAAVVPTGALGLLPLHAAWTPDPERPTGRRYTLDDIAVTFVPNARALRAAAGVATTIAPDSLLVIADPAPSHRPRLPYAQVETAGACRGFPGRHEQLVGDRATKAAVGRSMSRFPVVHFACHGSTNVAEPLDSALHLSRDETLAVREIMALRLAGVRLAVLSACETAVPDLELLDEVVSLPTALLQARVGGVIATLWSVQDESATVLMLRFYELWRGEGLHPREALREAQRWVRDSTLADKCSRFPEAPDLVAASTLTESTRAWTMAHRAHRDPSQWAAFVYVGA